jgi:uncharacterized protein (DUF736 family)
MANLHNKILNQYTFQSKDDLLEHLRNNKIPISHQDLRKDKQLSEKHAFSRLLDTWIDNNHIIYPITYEHVDKPDFRVHFNKHNMGIEHTKAITQNDNYLSAVAEEEDISGVYFIDIIRRDAPKLTREKIRKELRNPSLEGVGFGDDGFEKEWAACVMDSIFKKTEDFKRPEFIKYDKNILLIFEDHAPIRNVAIAMKYLNQKLTEYWCKNIRFDKIFIDCSKGYIIDIDCSDRSYRVFEIKEKI